MNMLKSKMIFILDLKYIYYYIISYYTFELQQINVWTISKEGKYKNIIIAI